MVLNLIDNMNNGKHLARINKYIFELSELTMEESRKTLEEIKTVKHTTFKLIEYFGGLDGVHNVDDFLASKIEALLNDENDKDEAFVKRYLNNKSLKLKDIIEIHKHLIKIRDKISALREYNLRLREERWIISNKKDTLI